MMRAIWTSASILVYTASPVLGQQTVSCPALNELSAYTAERHSAPFSVSEEGIVLRNTDFRAVTPLSGEVHNLLTRMVGRLSDQGTQLSILVPPPRGIDLLDEAQFDQIVSLRSDQDRVSSWRDILNSYDDLIESLASSGASAPNIKRFYEESQFADDFYFAGNSHWTPSGSWISAYAVRDALLKDGISGLADLDSKFFISADGELEQPGNLSRVVDTICGGETPSEMAAYRTVSPIVDDGLSSALFGDAPAGEGALEIVLLGTSFSNGSNSDRFFAGDAMNYHLQTQVDNRAVHAGGALTSIESYFLNTDILPDIVVWEFKPNMLSYMGRQVWRQALGSLYPACDPDHWATINMTKEIPQNGEINDLAMGWSVQNIMNVTISGDPIDEFEYVLDLGGSTSNMKMTRSTNRYPEGMMPDFWRTYVGASDLESALVGPSAVSLRFDAALAGREVSVTGCLIE